MEMQAVDPDDSDASSGDSAAPRTETGGAASGKEPEEAAKPTGFGAARVFAELPLSAATQASLQAASYVSLTAIQRAAIPHALAGRDILGAAKTGSGKTLAFLVPVSGSGTELRLYITASACRLLESITRACPWKTQLLEALFRARWGRLDGLGALVLSPTRELAMQIFEELRRVGCRHAFSAGMLIGGKNIKAERDVVNGAASSATSQCMPVSALLECTSPSVQEYRISFTRPICLQA